MIKPLATTNEGLEVSSETDEVELALAQLEEAVSEHYSRNKAYSEASREINLIEAVNRDRDRLAAELDDALARNEALFNANTAVSSRLSKLIASLRLYAERMKVEN